MFLKKHGILSVNINAVNAGAPGDNDIQGEINVRDGAFSGILNKKSRPANRNGFAQARYAGSGRIGRRSIRSGGGFAGSGPGLLLGNEILEMLLLLLQLLQIQIRLSR